MMLFKVLMLGFLVVLLGAASPVCAQDGAGIIPERILGKADAPITVEEYVSLTCPHCAEFYITILPELEKRYVDTGKVRFILRDFPLDGVSLKAATLARCMPADSYYPFIKILYENQTSWVSKPDYENILTNYAKLGGLTDAKAKACLSDKAMQDAIVAERTDASQKYNIDSTPTFVINNGADTLKGAQAIETFAASFDKQLAAKKQ